MKALLNIFALMAVTGFIFVSTKHVHAICLSSTWQSERRANENANGTPVPKNDPISIAAIHFVFPFTCYLYFDISLVRA